jgi:hypothetical protein
MSRPWNITPSTHGRQGTSEAWRKDAGKEKEAERWRNESDHEDGFRLREKIKGGQKTFNLLVGKDDDHDELDMDVEDDGSLFINKLKLEEKERQESLDKLDRRIKRAEEKDPGSA